MPQERLDLLELTRSQSFRPVSPNQAANASQPAVIQPTFFFFFMVPPDGAVRRCAEIMRTHNRAFRFAYAGSASS